jgi:hypothetical protein
MKSLLILSMLFGALFMGLPLSEQVNPELEMNLRMEEIFQEKIKVYDYNGNLLKELKKSEVVTNDISVMDHVMLDESDFAFEHLGDYYYFQED